MDDFDILENTPSSLSLHAGEEIVHTFAASVQPAGSTSSANAQGGRIMLTTQRVVWRANKGGSEDEIQFQDITSTMVSNNASKRVCLKLNTIQAPLGKIFYFTSSDSRNDLKTFTDSLLKYSRMYKEKNDDVKSQGNSNPSGNNITNSSSSITNSNGSIANSSGSITSNNNSANSISSSNNSITNSNSNSSNSINTSGSNISISSNTNNNTNSVNSNITNNGYSNHNNHSNHSSSNSSATNSSYANSSFSQHNLSQQSRRPTQESSSHSPPASRSAKKDDVFITSDVTDDFFNIKRDSPVRMDKPASTSSNDFHIEVRSPQKSADGTYVTYEVCFKLGQQTKEVIERRRYKDFEWLHTRLVQAYHLKVIVPELPRKSLLSNTTLEFMIKRCKKLDQFMKQVVQHPVLRSSQYLQTFLDGNIEHESGVAAIMGSIENHLVKLTAPPVFIDSDDVGTYNDVEMDFRCVRGLCDRWEVTPKKLPFEKFLVVVLGTTSAGKSAFVNHFLGLQVKRSAVGQMDTHFSMVETLPKEKFAQISGKEEPWPEFSDEQLAKKIQGDVHSDPRYGHVFMYLDTSMTLARYGAQFIKYAQYISKFGLVRSIVVNEHYLRGDGEQVQHAKRTILLDSPGFDPGKEHDHAEKFLGNLKILQLFCSMSDISLFMIPATQMNMVAGQIATLEFSVLYSIHGVEYVDRVLNELLTSTSPAGGHSLLPSINDIKNFVVNRFSTAAADEREVEYKGTVVWDKMRFVITKIDEVHEQAGENPKVLNEQYYELGRLLGKNFKFLEAPTFSQCMCISLPEHQHNGGGAGGARVYNSNTGDLVALLSMIRSLNSESSYMTRLENAIQTMCLDLKSTIKASWSHYISPVQWMSSDATSLEEIYRRSCGRLKKMGNVKNVNPNFNEGL